MPIITLHRRQMFKLSIPYWVFINEHPIGIMQGKEVSIELPPAQFDLSIRILFRPFKAANKREQSEACLSYALQGGGRPIGQPIQHNDKLPLGIPKGDAFITKWRKNDGFRPVSFYIETIEQ